jgi:hypothetical protein
LRSGSSLGAQQPGHRSDIACGVVFRDDGMLRDSLAQVRWELGLDVLQVIYLRADEI